MYIYILTVKVIQYILIKSLLSLKDNFEIIKLIKMFQYYIQIFKYII